MCANKINNYYNYSLDRRTVDWPLMGSPIPILSIIFSYIYFVKVLGPNWMKNRKAFQIEGLIVAYNIVMVVLSALFFIIVTICQTFDIREQLN